MPIYEGSPRASENTAEDIFVGFQLQILELDRVKDKKEIKGIAEKALSFLDDLEANKGGDQRSINSARSHIKVFTGKPLSTRKMESINTESIKGDGHCLFRSTAHGLVDLSRADKSFIPRLKKEQAKFAKTNKKLANDLGTLIKLLPQGRMKSDALQQTLRNLSCSFYEATAPKWVANDPSYFNSMRKNAWGGETQLSAFAKVLGIRIDVINVPEKKTESIGVAKAPDIRIKFTGGHYDLVKRVDSQAKRVITPKPEVQRPRYQPALQFMRVQ